MLGLVALGGIWRIHASWMRNSSPKRSSALMLIQLNASSFSIGDDFERRTSREPSSVFSPKIPMMEDSNSSFEPINLNTVPWPIPAAAAISRTVVPS